MPLHPLWLFTAILTETIGTTALQASQQFAERQGMSSWHLLFPAPELSDRLLAAGRTRAPVRFRTHAPEPAGATPLEWPV